MSAAVLETSGDFFSVQLMKTALRPEKSCDRLDVEGMGGTNGACRKPAVHCPIFQPPKESEAFYALGSALPLSNDVATL